MTILHCFLFSLNSLIVNTNLLNIYLYRQFYSVHKHFTSHSFYITITAIIFNVAHNQIVYIS
jgi:hypothetical protein